jgi:phage terminase small subunit
VEGSGERKMINKNVKPIKLKKGETIDYALKTKRPRKLSPKQEKFAQVFYETGNATEAMRQAYDCTNWASGSINQEAHKLTKNPNIILRLSELNAPCLEKLKVSKEKTLKRLMQGQEFDIRNLYDEDGRLKKPKELDEDTAKGVVGIKYDGQTGAITEYKIIDIKGCAELIGKHLKLWTDKLEIDMGESLAEDIRKGRERALNGDA